MEMSDAEVRHQSSLTSERAFNEDYVESLKLRARTHARAIRMRVRTRNQFWTGTNEDNGVSTIEPGPLYGRVALNEPIPGVPPVFYIGPSFYQSEDGNVLVVNWQTPVARHFYEESTVSSSTRPSVRARRTFIPIGEDIQDFVDDGDRIAFEVAAIGPLDIPRPPKVDDKDTSRSAVDDKDTSRSAVDDRFDLERRLDVVSEIEDASTVSPSRVRSDNLSTPSSPAVLNEDDTIPIVTEDVGVRPAHPIALRARAAVIAALDRPRTGRLSPLLATLQADQYELVTWLDDVPLIVDGPPGTGKTVIAAHRAAYLADDSRPGGAVGKVMLVGPTSQYTDQVSDSLGRLTTGDVRVMSVIELLTNFAGLRQIPRDYRGEDDWLGTSVNLGRLVERTCGELRRAGRLSGTSGLDRKTLFEELKSRSPLVKSLTEDEDLYEWLADLEKLETAEKQIKRLPLLASIGVATSSHSSVRYDHLIVDEGQDVRPLEWRVLLERLSVPAGVTILGDMNQRRSDFTSSSWQELAEIHGLDIGGRGPELRTITTGYRTTREILEFASQLLPRGQRSVTALRNGAEPLVLKVTTDAVVRKSIEQAIDLADRYPLGQIAVITMKPKEVSDGFRTRDWTRTTFHNGWTLRGMTVMILEPNSARGLEFDGVVVVEPSRFPTNLGRNGLLYTSLTRAVRDLVVVYSNSLPSGLRARR
jgi:DNA helicase IV